MRHADLAPTAPPTVASPLAPHADHALRDRAAITAAWLLVAAAGALAVLLYISTVTALPRAVRLADGTLNVFAAGLAIPTLTALLSLAQGTQRRWPAVLAFGGALLPWYRIANSERSYALFLSPIGLLWLLALGGLLLAPVAIFARPLPPQH
jgi:hypothetical protein